MSVDPIQLAHRAERKGFSHLHVVSFEETNVVGNVYFARHIAWQGRCRELFLMEHAPEVLKELSGDLRMVTLKTGCEYYEEIKAFDTIEVLMSLAHLKQNRIGLDFEYRRLAQGIHTVVAAGFQEVGCMRIDGPRIVPIALPAALERALRPYQR